MIQIYGVPLKVMWKDFILADVNQEKGTEKEGAEFMKVSFETGKTGSLPPPIMSQYTTTFTHMPPPP